MVQRSSRVRWQGRDGPCRADDEKRGHPCQRVLNGPQHGRRPADLKFGQRRRRYIDHWSTPIAGANRRIHTWRIATATSAKNSTPVGDQVIVRSNSPNA
ncbi:Uncharacterised protein [Mycobacteroides abscessus subsp. massiliense]|nr:Uncharacterised protein [Mycobacteroides abscessus subsp. massiliense]